MTQLRKFADRLRRQTGADFFVNINCFPGLRNRWINRDDGFVARPLLQKRLSKSETSKNFLLEYAGCNRDSLDRPVYGKGESADKALAALLENMAGKSFTAQLGRRKITIRVPANIAD